MSYQIHEFSKDQYIKYPHKKKQIVFHHTVSPSNSVFGDIAWWSQTSQRIATYLIIDKFGTKHKLFDPKYWAYHLYVNSKNNNIDKPLKTRNIDRFLNRGSIAIELDSAGGLKERNGKWWTAYGKMIPEQFIDFYPKGFRGFEAFEKYYPEQISSFIEEVKFLSEKFDIPVQYRPEIWDIDIKALTGQRGLYSHVSYRTDKSDCHPSKDLIKALKTL